MIKRLPLYERKSEIFREIFGAEAKEFETINERIEDVRNQFVVDTATWGLKVYEKELKIVVPFDSSIENRRTAIKTKMRSGGKVDRALLEAVASSILGTKVTVDFNGRIIFEFKPDRNTPITNMDYFYRTIELTRPAHLAFELHASMKEILLLKAKSYSFQVPYPITNMFRTADTPGVKANIQFDLREKAYSFSVIYPITNMFTTQGITGRILEEVSFQAEATSNEVVYKRVGNTIAGRGTI